MDDLEPRVSDVINDYNICDLAYMYVNLEQQNAKLVEALENIIETYKTRAYRESCSLIEMGECAQKTLAEVNNAEV